MKKFLFAISSLAVAGTVWAAASDMKMVTYFPVPYMSYYDLNVSGTCDVGVLGCQLNTGALNVTKKDAVTSGYQDETFNTGTINLKQGTLNLDKGATSAVTFVSNGTGSYFNTGNNTSAGGTGDIQFTGNVSLSTHNVASVEVTQKVDNLILKDSAFPACNSNMTWVTATINNGSGVFLQCGSAESICNNTDSQRQQVSACCTQAGYRWNSSSTPHCYQTCSGKDWSGSPSLQSYSEEGSVSSGVHWLRTTKPWNEVLQLMLALPGVSGFCSGASSGRVSGSPDVRDNLSDCSVLVSTSSSASSQTCGFLYEMGTDAPDDYSEETTRSYIVGSATCSSSTTSWTCSSANRCGSEIGTCS